MARCLYTAWQRLLDTSTLRHDASIGGAVGRNQKVDVIWTQKISEARQSIGCRTSWIHFHEIEAMEEAVGKAIWEEKRKSRSPTEEF